MYQSRLEGFGGIEVSKQKTRKVIQNVDKLSMSLRDAMTEVEVNDVVVDDLIVKLKAEARKAQAAFKEFEKTLDEYVESKVVW